MREIHARRLNAKEVTVPKNGEHFIFPSADGTVKMSGGDQVFRKSTLIRDHTERGEERIGDLLGRIGRGLNHQTQLTADSEARNDYWTIPGNYIYRHHVQPRVKLHDVPERRISPSTSAIRWRGQADKYDLDCVAGKPDRRLLER